MSVIYLHSTHSFLGCGWVPREDGSILVVSQRALFTSVACSKGFIVGVNDPAGGSLSAHVEEDIPSRVHGGYWLHPRTGSLAQLPFRAWIGGGDVHADVIDPL